MYGTWQLLPTIMLDNTKLCVIFLNPILDDKSKKMHITFYFKPFCPSSHHFCCLLLLSAYVLRFIVLLSSEVNFSICSRRKKQTTFSGQIILFR